MKTLLFVCVVICCLSTCHSYETTLAQTTNGPILGLQMPGYRRFQGVPFATPPLGFLRFKNPIPPTHWTDNPPVNCTYFDIGCAQRARSLDVPKNKSEDCLYLEVYAPPKKEVNDASVMIFFYGGDFKEGGESFKLYNGTHFARDTNTVVIIPNYRVDVLGWLYTKWGDANVGLSDQRLAIQWAYDNAKNFGGDNSKITIFGQSAGGESVLIHFSTPDVPTASLWSGGIVESGPPMTFRDIPSAMVLGVSVAVSLNCSYDNEKCFEDKTTEQILKAGAVINVPLDFSEGFAEWSPVNTRDIYFPQDPFDAFKKGEITKNKTLTIGTNKNDGMLFGFSLGKGVDHYVSELDYIGLITGLFIDPLKVLAVLKRYPPVFFGNNNFVLSQVITDFLFKCAAKRLAMLSLNHTRATYLYQFTQKSPNLCFWPPHQKYCCDYVCHGDELLYVYKDFDGELTTNQSSLSISMSSYWSSLSKYGNPNTENDGKFVNWEPFQSETFNSINLKFPPVMVLDMEKETCDFWFGINGWE